jgi:hypothetical protein
MLDHFLRSFLVCVSLFVGLFLWSGIAPAKDAGTFMLFASAASNKTQEKSDKALPEIPANLDQEKINEIIAGLNDDQARRLLIHELELAAEAAASAKQQTAP